MQIYARNRERGQAIARAVRCACADDTKRIAEADIYLMAVSDRAVPKLSESFDFGDAVVAHTAGSVALGELEPTLRLSPGVGMSGPGHRAKGLAAEAPDNLKSRDGLLVRNTFAAYTHLFAPAVPHWAARFAAACRKNA